MYRYSNYTASDDYDVFHNTHLQAPAFLYRTGRKVVSSTFVSNRIYGLTVNSVPLRAIMDEVHPSL